MYFLFMYFYFIFKQKLQNALPEYLFSTIKRDKHAIPYPVNANWRTVSPFEHLILAWLMVNGSSPPTE